MKKITLELTATEARHILNLLQDDRIDTFYQKAAAYNDRCLRMIRKIDSALRGIPQVKRSDSSQCVCMGDIEIVAPRRQGGF